MGRKTTYDKCSLCTFVDTSDKFMDGRCPNCGSSDVDDADYDQYEDEEEETLY